MLTELQHEKQDNDIILSNVLAYADDLVLIADSEVELQRLINIVKKWCATLKLQVNLDKTKVVHYRKVRKSQTKFTFRWEDQEIEITNGYRYLDVFLDQNLNFETHCNNISNSAGRALGKILSKFAAFKDIGYFTFTKLFRSNVESVMGYGVSAISKKKYNFEKIQSRGMRYFMGVHPKTPIPALFGDMGWVPFKYRRWLYMCRTWNRFVNMDESRLNKQIFLIDYYANTFNWCTEFYEICCMLDLEDHYENMQLIDTDIFEERMHSHAEEKWKEWVLSKPKLRTYKIFKHKLEPETYLTSNISRSKRSIFAQFRSGILPLDIEIGRFRGLPENERICPLCPQRSVESETHFLLNCTHYEFLRRKMIRDTNIQQYNDPQKIDMLMNSHQQTCCTYVFKFWNRRRNTLIK